MRGMLAGLLLLSSGCLQRSPFQPETLFVTTVSSPSTLLLHGDTLYVGAYNSDTHKGVVGRVPIAGGELQTLATWSQQLAPRHMVTDGVSLYLTVIDGASNTGKGEVWRLPLDGRGGVKVLATGQYGVCGIAVDSSQVYWGASTSTSMGRFEIFALPKAGGGTPTPLQAVSGGRGGGGCDIVAGATNIYWNDVDLGQLIAQPKDPNAAPCALTNSAANDVAGVYQGDAGLTSGGGYVYWSGGDAIYRVKPTDASCNTPLEAETVVKGSRITALALDGSRIYWVRSSQDNGGSDSNNGRIMQAGISSGSASSVSLRNGNPIALAVGSTYVYWADTISDAIMRLPKR